MKPIDDFELIAYFKNNRLHDSGQSLPRQIQSTLPSHPRLRLVVDRGFHSKLYFRGAVIWHFQIDESELVAQFEAENGYVLFVAERDNHSPKFSTLAIYYVLKNFSGAEYGTISGWDGSYTQWEQFKIMVGPMSDRFEAGPHPLKQVHIVNDRRLEFEVSGIGWFSLTLYEYRPRRFRFSWSDFHHLNAKFWHARYFRVWRLRDDDPA